MERPPRPPPNGDEGAARDLLESGQLEKDEDWIVVPVEYLPKPDAPPPDKT